MKLNNVKGIIFDYDGVIANSDVFNKKALIFAAKQVGLNFTEDDFKNYFAGKTLYDGTKDFLVAYNKTEFYDDFIKAKKSFDSEYKREVIPFKRSLTFIREYYTKLRFCIASGSRKILIEDFIEKFDLDDCFEFVVAAEDYEVGKPAPDAYLLAAEKLDMKKSDLIIIEDAPKGIAAAKLADIRCVAVLQTHHENELKESDMIIKDLSFLKITE